MSCRILYTRGSHFLLNFSTEPTQCRTNIVNEGLNVVFVIVSVSSQKKTQDDVYSRYVKVSFSFSKRCICTDVKYIHRQGFSIAIEERGGETQGLGEYNIVQTSWLGTAVAPCRPDCPRRSVLMSASLPPSHGPKKSLSSVLGVTG